MEKATKKTYKKPKVSKDVALTQGIKCTRQWNEGGAWPDSDDD